MAKKTPKQNTSVAAEGAVKENKVEEPVVQKAAVNVESKADKKKQKANNGKQSKKKDTDKKPNIFQRMGKGLKGIFSELKKVTWLKGKDVVKNTAVVLTVVVLFFIVLFIIDYILAGLLGLVVEGKWTTVFI